MSWVFFRSSVKSVSSGSMIAVQGLAMNQSSGGEKIALCIVCFAYSLLLVVVIFPLLSY